MAKLRTPTLEDLAKDLGSDAKQLASYLQSLYTSHYQKSGQGKVVTISCKVVENKHVAAELVDWVGQRLRDPDLSFKSYFREALEMIDESRKAYISYSDGRPASAVVLGLVDKHLQISKVVSGWRESGCNSLETFWATAVEPLILLSLLPFVDKPSKTQINRLRLFAARCSELDCDDSSLSTLCLRFLNEAATELELLSKRKVFQQALAEYYANDYVKDPSYAAVVEMGFRPLEQMCNPKVGWQEMCEVAYRISCSASKLRPTAEIANLLRECLPCPWA